MTCLGVTILILLVSINMINLLLWGVTFTYTIIIILFLEVTVVIPLPVLFYEPIIRDLRIGGPLLTPGSEIYGNRKHLLIKDLNTVNHF